MLVDGLRSLANWSASAPCGPSDTGRTKVKAGPSMSWSGLRFVRTRRFRTRSASSIRPPSRGHRWIAPPALRPRLLSVRDLGFVPFRVRLRDRVAKFYARRKWSRKRFERDCSIKSSLAVAPAPGGNFRPTCHSLELLGERESRTNSYLVRPAIFLSGPRRQAAERHAVRARLGRGWKGSQNHFHHRRS